MLFLQMIVQARRPESPSLYTNEEAPSRTCSRQKLSYSNGTVVVDEDDSSSSEMQLTSRQSGDSLASLLPPTGNQFFCYSSCGVCVFQENGGGSQQALCRRSLTLFRPRTCTWSRTHQAALMSWIPFCTLHRFRAELTLFMSR